MTGSKEKIKNLEKLFEPVADFLIGQGLKMQQALEALKVAMIYAAVNTLEKKKEKVTVSKISVMTGIHRRDVVRIYKVGNKKVNEIDLISKIIGLWSYGGKYLNKKGKPRDLIFDGNDSEFAELVYAVSSELKPSTILFEMQRANYVKVDGNKVKLQNKAAVSNKDLEAGFHMLSDDIGDLITAVTKNLYTDTRQLHAKTIYDAIPESFLPEIREWMLNKGAKYHDEVSRYLAGFDQDINPKKKYQQEKKARVAFGTFGTTKDEE